MDPENLNVINGSNGKVGNVEMYHVEYVVPTRHPCRFLFF